MYFDDRAVEADCLDPDPDELLMLQFFEQAIEHTGLGPVVHARVDGVAVAEAFGQCALVAAVFRDVQDRLDDLKVGERNVATLHRQKRLDPRELLCSDFHASQKITNPRRIVLLRPEQQVEP